jgi:ATP-dependent Clp protease ATP-binding subunit ClpA
MHNKGLDLKFDTKVINYITKRVYNPEFWAREVRRYIVDTIEDFIAEKIIANRSKKLFKLDIEKDELIVK